MILNQWIEDLGNWCPAQIYYYFEDNECGRWCIYLRWSGERGDEPWSAEFVRCDEAWNFLWDSPDNINLLKETEHTPGTVIGYYYDKEYPFLEEETLRRVKLHLSKLNIEATI